MALFFCLVDGKCGLGYCIDMETKLFTFVRIADGDKVVVLDKVVREGWEGLTFPGGKVERTRVYVPRRFVR